MDNRVEGLRQKPLEIHGLVCRNIECPDGDEPCQWGLQGFEPLEVKV